MSTNNISIKHIEELITLLHFLGVNNLNIIRNRTVEFFFELYNGNDIDTALELMKYNTESINRSTMFKDFKFDLNISSVKMYYKILDEVIEYNINFKLDNEERRMILYIKDSEHLKRFNVKQHYYTLLFYYNLLNFHSTMFVGPFVDFYNLIIDTFDNVVECFASIFNHTSDKFYSLFEEEKEYGALGNFFDRFLLDKFNVYLINPPFTEFIIRKTLRYISKKLNTENNNMLVILYLPIWPDVLIPFDKSITNFNVVKFKTNLHKVYNHLIKVERCDNINTEIYLIANYKLDLNKLKNKIQETIYCTTDAIKEKDKFINKYLIGKEEIYKQKRIIRY